MAAPATIDEFIDLIRKSGVVEENRLDAYLEKLGTAAALPEDLGRAAGVLVRDGILTHFQAEQILAGKWRRFTIGKYKVLERLGSGGMGSVYLCEHLFMRRRVAVKVLPTAKAEDPSALERFYREARAVAALDHPNIVRAYDIDQDEKLHFLVMEYIDGSSLQEIVKRFGPMDHRRAAHYIRQAAAGLHHAHLAAGLIHRDIKPGNILLDRRGTIKVLDMGLARFFNDDEQPITQKFDENVLGTADYLAPEQALDSHNVDIRADIYSLGATFYFCLTGSTPFEGTVAQKLIWHQTRPPRPVRHARPDVPEGLAAIVEKMMAKDPTQRYATPLEVEDALASWTTEPIDPPPEHEMPRLSPAALTPPVPADAAAMAPASGPTFSPPPAPRYDSKPVILGPSSGLKAPGSTTVSRVPTRTSAQPARASSRPRESSNSLSFEPQRQAAPSETDDINARADTAPQVYLKPVPAAPAPVAEVDNDLFTRLRRQPALVWGGAASVAVFILICLGIWAMSGGKDQKVPSIPIVVAPRSHQPMTIRVTRAGGPDSRATVREALYIAQPGDRIAVADDEIEEALEDVVVSKFGNGVTIEGANSSHSVHWICPAPGDQANGRKDEKFLAFRDVKDLHIQGFRFDGMNRVDDAVRIRSACPGLSFEDVSFEGFNRAAVVFADADGRTEGNTCILFNRARFLAGKEIPSAIQFIALQGDGRNQGVAVKESRFEGPFQAAVRFSASAWRVEIASNRFYQCEVGILYERGDPARRLQANVQANTFYQISQRAIGFQAVPPEALPSRVGLTGNLFVLCSLIADLEAKDIYLEARQVFDISGNYRDAKSREGTLPLKCGLARNISLSTDPSDDAKFLGGPRYRLTPE
jgi:serine/threonine protein kinase